MGFIQIGSLKQRRHAALVSVRPPSGQRADSSFSLRFYQLKTAFCIHSPPPPETQHAASFLQQRPFVAAHSFSRERTERRRKQAAAAAAERERGAHPCGVIMYDVPSSIPVFLTRISCLGNNKQTFKRCNQADEQIIVCAGNLNIYSRLN